MLSSYVFERILNSKHTYRTGSLKKDLKIIILINLVLIFYLFDITTQPIEFSILGKLHICSGNWGSFNFSFKH